MKSTRSGSSGDRIAVKVPVSEIPVSARASSAFACGFLPDPFPILLEDKSRLDWPGAAYKPSVHVGVGQANITHTLVGARALKRLIDEGSAVWAVELRCPKTLMSRVETCRSERQSVTWSEDDVDEDIYVMPGVLARESLSLGDAELSSVWKGVPLQAPQGWWLVRGNVRRANTLAESLLKFQRQDDLKTGRMEVKPDEGSGRLRFTVWLASDLFEHVESNRTLKIAALVGA